MNFKEILKLLIVFLIFITIIFTMIFRYNTEKQMIDLKKMQYEYKRYPTRKDFNMLESKFDSLAFEFKIYKRKANSEIKDLFFNDKYKWIEGKTTQEIDSILKEKIF